MQRLRPAQPGASVPVFKLYGDGVDWPAPDFLHCESIPSRSRLHGWEIRPHRHADLTQLLFLRQGWADIELEGQRARVEQPAVQLVPPLCVHGFRFSDAVDGHVLTLAAPLVASLQQAMGDQRVVLERPGLYPLGEEGGWVAQVFEQLAAEYANPLLAARELAVQSLLGLLAAWLARQRQRRQASRRPAPGQAHLAAFTTLVEAHFREHWSLERYARQLGITTAHLRDVVMRLGGQGALATIHERLVLEARRELVYSTLSINQLSDALGFSEPAYFSRFFKRMTGQSPLAFRKAAAVQSVR
ncbi:MULTISPECIES: helix-turn-helix domain-containing protein [unclassified Pseudomonas]|uniref:helix-turn-helix domain-containing protein n=1 Tax=unclassified Pseudomonas TaxID=196821 RepID=UPI000BC80064|nr:MULTISPECIES: helix-turn-helix domain-containing protein [unclassified Pseudomonas]PVZ16208.1 AraC family transcriptional activator of pobA [Pseudomonas sp. URIL14HWK12:I12]PVZ25936.1 AraC family transcriptional activator of pobA [Pseudomonas sp. URIL14HWK12:I10]PVZ36540.1 AraC family transcriptional activator of pobA [Pseudomonas sp. URIL14HWK12:I11]SNZ13227.1 transcriptional regulator, AraC family [Pseudomonas sp. URIL14HWK12:I9]